MHERQPPVIRANRIAPATDLAGRFAESVEMCTRLTFRVSEAGAEALALRLALRKAKSSLEAVARIETPASMGDMEVAARSRHNAATITAGEVRQARFALAELKKVEGI